MNSITSTQTATAVNAPGFGSSERARPRGGPTSGGWVYATLALLLAAVWQLSHMGLYSARSDVGYWIGVSGAVMMLLLFAYPLRKRSPALARFGPAKVWFAVHMVLGVLGPGLVLAHSAFRIGSINAGVALVSMLVVAASGVVGRFIYLRVHRGLGGEVQSFEALRASLGLADSATRTALHFAPQAEARLLALQRHAGRPRDGWAEHLRRLLVLPWQIRAERRAILNEARAVMRRLAAEQQWSTKTLHSRERRVRKLVVGYTRSVLRVAQLAAYARLFSLWHVLHVPFVFLMVICAVVHVVAVHVY